MISKIYRFIGRNLLIFVYLCHFTLCNKLDVIVLIAFICGLAFIDAGTRED